MNLVRRKFLRLSALGAALPFLPPSAIAQAYPSHPVRFLIGFPAGGPNDILGRLIAQWLSERLQQPFAVENKPGVSGNVATEMVVRAPADGYTILLVGPANAIFEMLATRKPPIKDLASLQKALEKSPVAYGKTASAVIARLIAVNKRDSIDRGEMMLAALREYASTVRRYSF